MCRRPVTYLSRLSEKRGVTGKSGWTGTFRKGEKTTNTKDEDSEELDERVLTAIQLYLAKKVLDEFSTDKDGWQTICVVELFTDHVLQDSWYSKDDDIKRSVSDVRYYRQMSDIIHFDI